MYPDLVSGTNSATLLWEAPTRGSYRGRGCPTSRAHLPRAPAQELERTGAIYQYCARGGEVAEDPGDADDGGGAEDDWDGADDSGEADDRGGTDDREAADDRGEADDWGAADDPGEADDWADGDP